MSSMSAPDLSTLTRKPERAAARHELDALLDEVLVGTLSSIVDGLPWSVPMLFARQGDRVLLHGPSGAGLLRHSGGGSPVTFTVFTLDAIVVAPTAFDSSANYRSAVLRGTVTPLTGAEAREALNASPTGSCRAGRTRCRITPSARWRPPLSWPSPSNRARGS